MIYLTSFRLMMIVGLIAVIVFALYVLLHSLRKKMIERKQKTYLSRQSLLVLSLKHIVLGCLLAFIVIMLDSRDASNQLADIPKLLCKCDRLKIEDTFHDFEKGEISETCLSITEIDKIAKIAELFERRSFRRTVQLTGLYKMECISVTGYLGKTELVQFDLVHSAMEIPSSRIGRYYSVRSGGESIAEDIRLYLFPDRQRGWKYPHEDENSNKAIEL